MKVVRRAFQTKGIAWAKEMKHKIAWNFENNHNDDEISHFLSISYMCGTVGRYLSIIFSFNLYNPAKQVLSILQTRKLRHKKFK